ncbi:MAG: hypothetical protein IKU47_03310 [Oscillospiraceae bacterium]|nr:hypothetical protein [Oscillospiraceae bacterium]
MIIKFKNNISFDYLNALETEEHWNSASRRTLTVECKPDAISVDKLNALLSSEVNTTEITLTNEETGASNIYSGYILKIKCGIESKLVRAESPEAPAVYEDRLVFKLGKRTYIEEQLVRLGL